MYKVETSGSLLRAHRTLTAKRARRRIAPTVLLLGICSLLTDISSEMVATVLPLYLVSTLGFTPLQYGIVDGLYQGAAAFVRLAGGFIGDRRRKHKGVATVGYGLSAAASSRWRRSAAHSARSARSSSSTARARACAPRRATP
jgi:hypothetical protein